jgi:RNA polymerase sigma-70 factor (ECF subfamily)
VPRGAGRADPGTALMKTFYDEHAAVLWRYALRLTDDASQAEDVVQETRLRACQHPEVVGDAERSARAWLFTVARHLTIDEGLSARSRHVVSWLDNSSAPEQFVPDEVNTALDRLLIADAMTQLSADHRAVIERSYHRGWTTAQVAADLQIAEGTVKSRLHHGVQALRLTLQEIGVAR